MPFRRIDLTAVLSLGFDFKGEQTNLDAVAKDIRVINKNSSFPNLLVTDGNQTTGNDYVYILIAVTQFSL
jgi:hypothetical protein